MTELVAAPAVDEALRPVARESTPALVADQLRRAIMRGVFPPGAQLGEVELAGRFGVSRGPLREAMQRLVAEGLLRSERHRGLFVRDLGEADVRDVYTARLAVERGAALLILAGDPIPAVTRLERALAAMRAAAGGGDQAAGDGDQAAGAGLPAARVDPAALADADQAFHAELVAASGSPRLRRMAEGLLVETRMCLTALQDTAPDPDALVAEHAGLLEALRAGDADRLATALEAHMTDAVDRILGHS